MREELCLMLRRSVSQNRVSLLDLFLLLKYLISSQFIFCQSIRIDERHIPGYIMKVLM